MTDGLGRCLYCGGEYEARPLPFECPHCKRALKDMLGEHTTMRQMIDIARGAEKPLSLDITPNFVDGIDAVVFIVKDGGAWTQFSRRDGQPMTDADYARVDKKIDETLEGRDAPS